MNLLPTFLSLNGVHSVVLKNNLHSCLTVTFITYSSQMLHWQSRVCIIPFFNLQKDITQGYLVEHKGFWIRIKIQWSVTIPEPGSYFDAPKPGFYEKDGPLCINVMVNCLFYDSTNSKQIRVNLWPWTDSSLSSVPPVEEFQRSLKWPFSVLNKKKKTYPMGKSTSAPWSVMW